jgi:hypothetical protein
MRTLILGIIIGISLTVATTGAWTPGGEPSLGSPGYWGTMERDNERFEQSIERLEQERFRDEQRQSRRPC